ncbi:MAG: leucine--tRNA ligase [Planctomycetota bacterium]|jgi:leucyl-tRNA synthetase
MAETAEHTTEASSPNDHPHRYNATLANAIESSWQRRWEDGGVHHTPNPSGDLADGFERVDGRPRLFVLDMFPYPSGVGLHVGHPLGYIATDIIGRYKRMTGHNVLHAMGFDAFGLPAEQFAVQTGTHPRVTTEKNIDTMKRQLFRLGLAHDSRRSVATTDESFYRWTQWIFLRLYNSWFDDEQNRARPIEELVTLLDEGQRAPDPTQIPPNATWASLDENARADVIDSYRLAYQDEVPVNWCPMLGTVLSNEEVTADGKSERGNHPVYKRPLKQWMMRITKYAERLLDDLEIVEWPEPVKLMQRNWIGRSVGAQVGFEVTVRDGSTDAIEVFTTRPDTLFGATYVVLAPEHPMVDALPTDVDFGDVPARWKGAGQPGFDAPAGGFDRASDAIEAYQRFAERRSDVDRQVDAKDKTGVFTGCYATNPVNDRPVPIFIADYVLMGYGTGAIMAVPAHDERDYEFAQQFELPTPHVYTLEDGTQPEGCFAGDGIACNSSHADCTLDGLKTSDAKREITRWLEEHSKGRGTINYKLRDWLFSRQRYWGEPFPIVHDREGRVHALPESMLPVVLPPLDDFSPTSSDDPDAPPSPPLARAADWVTTTLDLGDGPKQYTRETNTMPQWAGSCWYYLRYLDPTNEGRFCADDVERYWMRPATEGESGGVDLYVGGVEHAVLHLLYARFWHKVLYDLGQVHSVEPFARLVNQGYIQAHAYTDERGVYVDAEAVEERDGAWFFEGEPVNREYGKMGKSLKNAVAPDDICHNYGADTLRLYEMYLGPLEQSKPWNTRDIVGSFRFLQRVWRCVIDEQTGEPIVTDDAPGEETLRVLHKTIAGVREDMDAMRFNTAIAKLIECTNHATTVVGKSGALPRVVGESLVRMLAPFAPHMSEELWHRLGHETYLLHEDFPVADESYLTEDSIEIPVQIMGKVRARIVIPADADQQATEDIARADEKVRSLLEGKTVRKVIVAPGRLINFVAN